MARRSQRNKKTKFTDPDADEDAAGEEVAQSFTIKSSLDWIGVKPEDIVDLRSLDDEFKHIKKVYFKKVLLTHPDKGGDAVAFTNVNLAWEYLREIYVKKSVPSFYGAEEPAAKKSFSKSSSYKSWDYYYEAAEEEVPIYKTELAKSGRSKCQKAMPKPPLKGQSEVRQVSHPPIAIGTVRIGVIDEESGSYGRWVHLECWRVPSKIWLGLPDPETCEDVGAFEAALDGMNEMLFCGFDELDEKSRASIVEHVRDKNNWARLTKRKAPAKSRPKKTANKRMITDGDGGNEEYSDEDILVTTIINKNKKNKLDSNLSTGSPSTAVVLQSSAKQAFSMVPTTENKHFLSGKTIVMTGIFPEIGGGTGLNLGKERLKKMLENFGAKVTGSVSGRTNILIVGEQPGRSKVDKARASDKCQLMGVADLKLAVEGKQELTAIEEAKIENFSSGYHGNAIGTIGWERRYGGIGWGGC